MNNHFDYERAYDKLMREDAILRGVTLIILIVGLLAITFA